MALRDTPAEQCTKTRPPPSTASAMKRYAFSQCRLSLPCEPATDSARAQQSRQVGGRARESNDRICYRDFELLACLISATASVTLIRGSKCRFSSGFASGAAPKTGTEDGTAASQVTNRGRVVDGYAQIAETLREEILFVRRHVYWWIQRVRACVRACARAQGYILWRFQCVCARVCVRAVTFTGGLRARTQREVRTMLRMHVCVCVRTHTHTYRRV